MLLCIPEYLPPIALHEQLCCPVAGATKEATKTELHPFGHVWQAFVTVLPAPLLGQVQYFLAALYVAPLIPQEHDALAAS